MSNVLGTNGYEKAVKSFTDASFSLSFEKINHDFLHLLPIAPANVLDVGSGVGQNSAALCELGYSVTAVEPLTDFLNIARAKYKSLEIDWVNDSLPNLNSLSNLKKRFSFILMDGVWHHLTLEERRQCIKRFSNILCIGGICAISLRNGPAGAGTHVFPTSCTELTNYASTFGFDVVLQIENQASKMPHKEDVIWSRVALRKR